MSPVAHSLWTLARGACAALTSPFVKHEMLQARVRFRVADRVEVAVGRRHPCFVASCDAQAFGLNGGRVSPAADMSFGASTTTGVFGGVHIFDVLLAGDIMRRWRAAAW